MSHLFRPLYGEHYLHLIILLAASRRSWPTSPARRGTRENHLAALSSHGETTSINAAAVDYK